MEAIRLTESVKVGVMITTDRATKTKNRFGVIVRKNQWVVMTHSQAVKEPQR